MQTTRVRLSPRTRLSYGQLDNLSICCWQIDNGVPDTARVVVAQHPSEFSWISLSIEYERAYHPRFRRPSLSVFVDDLAEFLDPLV